VEKGADICHMHTPVLSPFSIILVYIALSDCLVRAVVSVVDLDKPSKLNLRIPLVLYPFINMFPQVNTSEQFLPMPSRVGNEGMEGRFSEHLC
jgi:hypothetical protein